MSKQQPSPKARMNAKKRRGGTSSRDDGNNPVFVSTLKKSLSPLSLSSKGRAKCHMHLKGARVLRKNCIIISGLPKCQVQEYFVRFGKICQVVERPEGVEIATSANVDQGSTRGVLVTFMSERSASLAIREDGKTIGPGNTIGAHFAKIPYCDKFLYGKHCLDLECMYIHEDLSTLSPRSQSTAAKTFKAAFRTTPTILKKKKSASSNSTECWNNLKPKSFLEATRGEKACSEIDSEETESKFSCSHVTDDSDDDETRSGAFQLIDTPDSTLTNSCSGHSIGADREERIGDVLEFPAKQLFVKESRSPKQSTPTTVEAVKMCTSPWDFQSPIQIEKDNFPKQLSNENFEKSMTHFAMNDDSQRNRVNPINCTVATKVSNGINRTHQHQTATTTSQQRVQYPAAAFSSQSQYGLQPPQLPRLAFGMSMPHVFPNYCPSVRYVPVSGYHPGQHVFAHQYAYYHQKHHPYGVRY